MKRFLWLLPAVAVLIGAYLLPELLLKASMARVENKTYTSDALASWQGNGTTLSLGEKLTLLQKPNDASQYSYDFGAVTEDGTLREKYFAELRLLRDSGIVSAELCDTLSARELTISKAVLLNMERGESLSVYRVQYGDGTYVLTDAQSGKLLTIVASTRSFDAREDTVGKLINWHRDHYPNWAGYYGAEDAESYSVMEFESDLFEESFYLYAQRFALDGVELGFTVSYNDYLQTITWRPNTAGVVNWLLTGEASDAADLSDLIG